MKILKSGANHCAGYHRNVVVIAWGVETTVPAVAQTREAILEVGARRPTGIGLLNIVGDDSQLPSADARRALSDVMRDVGPHVKRSAFVHEASGVKGAAIRGVVRALTLLGKPPYPHLIFESVDSAAAWLTVGLPADGGGPFPSAELVQAVHEMRAEFELRRR